jgi:hypothetical protein
MVQNAALLAALERKLIAGTKADVALNFRIVDALYDEARSLGVFPFPDKLAGLDVDIRIARIVNGVQRAS